MQKAKEKMIMEIGLNEVLRGLLICSLFLSLLGDGLASVDFVDDYAACENTSPRVSLERLRAMGAKQLNAQASEFEIEKGIILSLVYEEEILVAAKVFLTRQYGDRDLRRMNSELKNSKCRYCLSRAAYEKLIKIIGSIKPLGRFEQINPIAIIPQTGWTVRTEEYACADVIRQERNCKKTRNGADCGILDFKVFYKMPLNGKIEAKLIRKQGANAALEFSTYFIVIAGRELQVSQYDYDRLSEGQIVRLERTILNNPVRIVSVKDMSPKN